MKLLIAPEHCNNLLRDTIALLTFLNNNKKQLTQLSVELSKSIKQHTLVLPNSCVKGTEEIYQFFVKYLSSDTSYNSYKCEPVKQQNEPTQDLQDYIKDAINAGDEQYEKPVFPKPNTSSNNVQQKQQKQQINKTYQKVAEVASAIDQEEPDIQDLLFAAVRGGGTI